MEKHEAAPSFLSTIPVELWFYTEQARICFFIYKMRVAIDRAVMMK